VATNGAVRVDYRYDAFAAIGVGRGSLRPAIRVTHKRFRSRQKHSTHWLVRPDFCDSDLPCD